MRRALLLLAALLASCSSEAAPSCPFTPVGQLTFEAIHVTTLAADFDPALGVSACSFDADFPTSIVFSGTLTRDPDGPAAALCRSGAVFFGTHEPSPWKVSIESDGAVLGSCGSTCSAHARTDIWGDIALDPDAPTSFDGVLVEQLTAKGGDCSGCALPCAARYELTGTTQVTP